MPRGFMPPAKQLSQLIPHREGTSTNYSEGPQGAPRRATKQQPTEQQPMDQQDAVGGEGIGHEGVRKGVFE